MLENVRIAEATPADLPQVLAVERAAFGGDDEAELVERLLDDPTAQPLLSLLAWAGDEAVGHILFTAASIEGPPRPVSVAILAPLAVVPDAQRQGVGGRLIEHGLQVMASRGVELVFLAGHPEYYPRHGFVPASPLGFAPPFPMPPEHEDAWMVRALRDEAIGSVQGRVVCADALNDPDYWRE